MSPKAIRTSIFLFALAAASAAFFHFVDPLSLGLGPCPFFRLTGLFCPGCGAMRALHQLANGHALAATGFNPFLFVVIPYLLAALASRAFPQRFRPAPSAFLLNALVVATIAFWFLRNVPAYPFSLLAP